MGTYRKTAPIKRRLFCAADAYEARAGSILIPCSRRVRQPLWLVFAVAVFALSVLLVLKFGTDQQTGLGRAALSQPTVSLERP